MATFAQFKRVEVVFLLLILVGKAHYVCQYAYSFYLLTSLEI